MEQTPIQALLDQASSASCYGWISEGLTNALAGMIAAANRSPDPLTRARRIEAMSAILSAHLRGR